MKEGFLNSIELDESREWLDALIELGRFPHLNI